MAKKAISVGRGPAAVTATSMPKGPPQMRKYTMTT
jgi:hypothetical protein